MRRLKKIPFFLLLLPVFFCVHGAVENFGLITFSEVLLTGIYICIGLALFFLVLLLLTKNKANASMVTFYAGCLYLFFGALQDWLLGNPWLSFLNRYTILLPVLVISIVCLVYFLKRKITVQKRLFLYLNILLIIYCLLDAGLLLNQSVINRKKYISPTFFDHKKVTSKPNIYYLLFDGYPGYTSLQSTFKFKNDSLYNFLHNNGFKILPTHSNYNFTIFSMSSVFNMQYVDSNYQHGLINKNDFRNRFVEVKNAAVFSMFKAMGYQVENYSIFDVGKLSCINPEISFMPIHTRVLTGKMFHKRLTRHVGWWLHGTKIQNAFTFKEPMFQADTTNLDISFKVKESLAKKSDKPKFCYAHWLMPHPPYFRDSTGALINKENQPWQNINDTRYFLPYLKYTNSIITALVDKIVLTDPAAIIIIMSDHGFRNYESQKKYDAMVYDNICAVRFPGNNSLPPKNAMSGVNFFRYLFNTGYGQQIPYLKDSTIWINY